MIIKITTQQNGIRENHFGRIGLSHLNVTYVIIMTNYCIGKDSWFYVAGQSLDLGIVKKAITISRD